MITSDNWIHNKKNTISLNDKVKKLIKIGDKLVLCQLHELERIKLSKHADRHSNYVNQLYTHYIINNLPKTYLHQEEIGNLTPSQQIKQGLLDLQNKIYNF